MKKLCLRSPAKLNLALDVLAKRSDGYHELKTVFERIDLCDRITLWPRADGLVKVICSHPQVPKGPANLAAKAAMLLKQDLNLAQGLNIHIEKKIPVAAGLAGGSSNAATVLLGLNRLWKLRLSQKQLRDYAGRLGSDVTFFIYDVSYAVGEGRGEKIRPLPIPTKLWHLLVTPRVKMLTKDVFGRLNLDLTNKMDSVNILLPYLRKSVPSAIGPKLANGLEPAILSLRPDFARLKKKMSDAGACGVCFSGSGPSVFALARSKQHAGQMKARLDRRFAQVKIVSTL